MLEFHQFSSQCPFSVAGSAPGSHISSTRIVRPPSSPPVWTVPRPFFAPRSLTRLKSSSHLFLRMSLNLGLTFPREVISFEQEYHPYYVVFLSAAYQSIYDTHMCFLLVILTLITWLIKVESRGISHCRAHIFHFVINKYLVRKYFEIMQISCFSSNLYPLILVATSEHRLQ